MNTNKNKHRWVAVWKILKEQEKKYIAYIINNTIVSLMYIVYTFLLADLINKISVWNLKGVAYSLGLLVGVRLLGIGLGRLLKKQDRMLYALNIICLREKYVDHVMCMESAQADHYSTGEMITRFSSDVENVIKLFNTTFTKTITNGAIILAILLYFDRSLKVHGSQARRVGHQNQSRE